MTGILATTLRPLAAAAASTARTNLPALLPHSQTQIISTLARSHIPTHSCSERLQPKQHLSQTSSPTIRANGPEKGDFFSTLALAEDPSKAGQIAAKLLEDGEALFDSAFYALAKPLFKLAEQYAASAKNRELRENCERFTDLAERGKNGTFPGF